MTAAGTPKKIKIDGRLMALITIAVLSAVVVVVAAFVLSFDALRAVGIGAKMSEDLSPLLPLSVDGAITVGTMSALVLKYLRRSAKYAWFVVLAGALVSIGCNVTHAVSSKTIVVDGLVTHVVTLHGFAAGLIAAIPAVALPVTFHLLLILIEAVMEALRTEDPDVIAKPRTPSTRKSRTADAEPVRPAAEPRTENPYATRTLPVRPDATIRTEDVGPVPAPRPESAANQARTDVVTEKIETEKEQTETPGAVKKADRDEFVNGLAWEIVAAGVTWKPDYEDLQARSGYGRSWCEKAVSAARKLAEGGTLTAADSTDDDDRTDAETDSVRTEQ